jgi:hypothetical protein
MSRKTEWIEIAEGQYRGLGQRLLSTSANEAGLLECASSILIRRSRSTPILNLKPRRADRHGRCRTP